jgi:hypothetical protein
MPQKDEDAQYTYRFGTYTNNAYNKYSGWYKSGTTTNPVYDEIPTTIDFIACYPTTIKKKYTVTWRAEPNGPILNSYTEDYGTDISGYQ